MNIRLYSNFFAALSVALVSGIGAILFLLQYDTSFKKVVELQVRQVFCHTFKSCLKGTVKRVNLLTGEIELENVAVTSLEHNDAWSWKAEQFIIQFSWLSYCVARKFDLSVTLDTLESHSHCVDSHIMILDHLKNFIAGAEGFPATLKSLTITKGDFKLKDVQKKLEYTTWFNGSYGTIQDTFYVHLAVENGFLLRDKQKIFDGFNGSLHSSIAQSNQPVIDAVVEGTLYLSSKESGKKICSLDGQWHKDRGQLFLHTLDTHYAFSLYNWRKDSEGLSGDLRCTLPLDFISTFVPSLCSIALEGEGTCQMHISLSDDLAIEGEFLCKDVRLGGKKLGALEVFGTYDQKIWRCKGNHFPSDSSDADILCDFEYDENLSCAHATLETVSTVSLWPSLGLELSHGLVEVDLKDCVVTSSYKLIGSKLGIQEPFNLEGTAIYANSLVVVQGRCGIKEFDTAFALAPVLTVTQCLIYEKKEKPLLDVKQCGQKVHGILDLQLLKDIGAQFFPYKIPGQAIFEIAVEPAGGMLKASVTLKEGNIRVPCTYTIVRDLTATCILDFVNKMVVVSDAVIELDKGQLECKRAVMRFDESGLIQSFFIPILFKKAFLTFQKEVFAVVSGFLLFSSHEGQEPMVQGNLVIDRSYCKKNIFSQLGGGHSVELPGFNALFLADQKDLCVALTVETKKPVEVKTSFLEMQVQIDAVLRGSVKNPELSGSINLVQGTLAFPYRPLSITHGTVYFLPHQLYDPTIELIAKGKIRKYQIVLRCNGSLQHPTINFESNPPLTEEQIITLLLAGTEEGSLSLAMPALIMQKLQNVIFGPEQSALKLEGYFKSLLEPLKHIRFIPGFSDQSGRGGFRGSIEIDVNDQLRAMIQKNFSLTEDIKFEVEYFFSDDITFRGIRDERADFGGEVEMRWKF